MAQSSSYGRQQYWNATRALTGDDDSRSRLKRALWEIGVALPEQIPPEVLSNWQATKNAITAAPEHPEGKIHTYVEGLSTDEVREVFDQIFEDLLVIVRKYG